MRRWILEIVRRNAVGNGSVRVTITRGKNAFDFLTSRAPMLTIISDALAASDIARGRQGIAASTLTLDRLIPNVKTTARSEFLLAGMAARQRQVDDIIFIGKNGRVREGTTSNVFIVKQEVICTPTARNIMPGLTRARVIALARSLGLRVRVANFSTKTLHSSDEIFLTSRLAEITPVIRLCEEQVGDGKPGRVTRIIMAAYQKYVRNCRTAAMHTAPLAETADYSQHP